MYELLSTTGEATNSEGAKFDVGYHFIDKSLTIGDEIVIESDSIDLLRIINTEKKKGDFSFIFAEYGTIVGIVASVGAIFLGNYKEPADYLLGFAVNILIYGIIGLTVGFLINKEVTYYTFEISYLQDKSIWTIRCHKVMYKVFEKYSVNYESESTNSSDVSNKLKSFIQEKVGQNTNFKSESESTDSISKIEKYHDLYQRGIISEEEFNDVKKKILEKEIEK